ncbi:hypothetical protein IQ07DRAFT_431009 [Pyrenochaeta sp. DS3sAY3a]|nr:hypothetical protein IQ07DRAFT_431009 [Pyrenochaeta sp. DS3sAY3a]
MTGDPPMCELDSDASDNRPMLQMPLNVSQGRDMVARLEVPNRSTYSASPYGMPHCVPQLDRFQYLANLETNLQSLPPPGMISGSNSHGSSPVSPFTPTPEGGVERQQYQGTIYAGGNMSPQSLISPSNSQYSVHGLGPDSKPSYPSLSILDSPVGSFGGSSTTNTPITTHEPFQTQITTYFPPSSSSSAQNLNTYQMANYDPFANQQANVQVEVWQSFEDLSPNALNDQNSGWYNRPNLGANTLNRNIPYEAHGIHEMAANTHDDHESHTHANSHSHLPEVYNEGSPQHASSNTKKSGNYPPVACDVCGTQFNGQYRNGNLRRHTRVLHNVVKAMDNACRVCKRVYNRKDATKKHEWKKHRLLDAKPTKRRD